VRETVLVKLGKCMKSLDAISGAQRNHEPACSGGCQLAADIGGTLTKGVGDKGVAPFVAAWAKARIDPLDPGAAIRPTLSARFQAERPTAWWNKPEPALIQELGKRNFPLETVDVSAPAQVPAVHACRIPFYGLHYEKLGFTTRYRRTRCAYDELKRAVSGEFKRVGSKRHSRSLPNRNGDKVIPPQLPSRRGFMFRSCRFPATSTCGIYDSRTAFRFAEQNPLTKDQGVKMASVPMNR